MSNSVALLENIYRGKCYIPEELAQAYRYLIDSGEFSKIRVRLGLR